MAVYLPKDRNGKYLVRIKTSKGALAAWQQGGYTVYKNTLPVTLHVSHAGEAERLFLAVKAAGG